MYTTWTSESATSSKQITHFYMLILRTFMTAISVSYLWKAWRVPMYTTWTSESATSSA
jgi:hypothetical protein